MIFILIIIVVVALFIINKNERQTVCINGGNIEKKNISNTTLIKNVEEIIYFSNIDENNIKSLFLLVHDDNKEEGKDIDTIITPILSSKADTTLISNYAIAKPEKGRIIIHTKTTDIKNTDEGYKNLFKKIKNDKLKKIITEETLTTNVLDFIRIILSNYGNIIVYKNKEDTLQILNLLKKLYPKLEPNKYKNPFNYEILMKLES